MIRNLLILHENGPHLFSVNFGECHSLGQDPNLISAFISVIHDLSYRVTGHTVEYIRLKKLNLMFLARTGLLFVMTADDDQKNQNIATLNRIADLFLTKYESILANTLLDTSKFADFRQILLELKIA